uniref:exodeoxyribonuclease VII small subunit n=1 Tax=Tessaracoccus timonensis TaxID=2161816 RepID=UPI000D5590B0|nr:exodeoxyribonuclease VII small subunit [Tessaracoccus timonensis]
MTDQPQLTYEQAREELVEVVKKLESGGESLADSMALWQRGEELAKLCQGFLDGAREQVEQARAVEQSSDE